MGLKKGVFHIQRLKKIPSNTFILLLTCPLVLVDKHMSQKTQVLPKIVCVTWLFIGLRYLLSKILFPKIIKGNYNNASNLMLISPTLLYTILNFSVLRWSYSWLVTSFYPRPGLLRFTSTSA